MKVKLLKTIRDGAGIKVAVRENRTPAAVAYVEGGVVECSEATGQKWIDKGWAEAVEEAEEGVDPEPEE